MDDHDPQAGPAPVQRLPEVDLDLGLIADSVDEDRAITRGRRRGAQEKSQSLTARAEAAKEDARRALELAVSALAEADGLRRAMESRSDIDIAKGILVERHRIDPQRAFNMLVELSQRHHTKLADVAKALVDDAGKRAE